MLAAYELEGEGLDGHQKFFRKPWAMATIMFLGMSFCLPFAYIEEARARRKQRSTADLERDAAAAPLLGDAYVRCFHHGLSSCRFNWRCTYCPYGFRIPAQFRCSQGADIGANPSSI